MKQKYSFKKGFSILELVIVLAIISILILGLTITINPGDRMASSRNNRRKAHLHSLQLTLNQYKQEEGDYPPCLDGNPSDLAECSDYLTPRFLDEIPEDESRCGYETGYLGWLEEGNLVLEAVCAEGGEEIKIKR